MVSSSDTMTTGATTALAGHLVLPVWKEITMAVFPGGVEVGAGDDGSVDDRSWM